MLGFRCSLFSAVRIRILDFSKPARQLNVERSVVANAVLARLRVMLANVARHFSERSAGIENPIDTFSLHLRGIVCRDRAAPAAEDFDVIRALFAQSIDYVGKKFNVPTVVTGDANRSNIFLDRGPHDIFDRAMITEINHFNAVPDELEIDRVDSTVVSVANRDSGENADR